MLTVIALPIGLLLQITVAVHQPTATRTPTPSIETYRVVLKDGTQYVTREPYRTSRPFHFELSLMLQVDTESPEQIDPVNRMLHTDCRFGLGFTMPWHPCGNRRMETRRRRRAGTSGLVDSPPREAEIQNR